MATSKNHPAASLMGLPRELRDEILAYLVLPGYVYTSSDKPNTANLHRSKVQANTFVDTRIYLPCRLSPNVLGVSRQLRDECLQCHNYILALSSSSPVSTAALDSEKQPQRSNSNILAERLGNELDEEAERLGDHGVRITLEAQRAQRGPFGYAIPVRDELSPRFLALLPLMKRARKLRLVIWAGYEWWNGSRPRAMKMVNGRPRIDPDAQPDKPDAVSFAVGKVLEQLPAVEELEIDIIAHVGEFSRWDLPVLAWENVQYWLDGPIAREGGQSLKKVNRKLAGVWDPKLTEAFYEQQETRVDASEKWHIKRHGDVRTVSKDHQTLGRKLCANKSSPR
jgi:hypothetical protein